MIDIDTEHIISLQTVPRHCPGRPSLSTIYRWVARGRNPLESILVGGRRFTSIEAIRRFIQQSKSGPVQSHESDARSQQIDRAERELEAAGI